MAEMEWTRRKVLKLIDAYRDRPLLWNSADPYYKIRNKKEDAWTELADLLETESTDIKKKIQSLLASFRRERQKMKSTAGASGEKVYITKWFAFKSLLFLDDKSQPAQAQDAESGTDELSDDYLDEENLHERLTSYLEQNAPQEKETSGAERPEYNAGTTVHRKRKQFRSPKRMFRKQKPKYPPITSACSVLRELAATTSASTKDDCSVYAEYICYKLRSYDTRIRAIVQHQINNIIFNADMGMYAHGNHRQLQKLLTFASSSEACYPSVTLSPSTSSTDTGGQLSSAMAQETPGNTSTSTNPDSAKTEAAETNDG